MILLGIRQALFAFSKHSKGESSVAKLRRGLYTGAMRTLRTLLIAVAVLFGVAPTRVAGQQPDTTRPSTAAFVGRMISSLDSTPVRQADVRLIFIDSVRQIRSRAGSDSLELFTDSARTRVTVSDSTGAFAIRRLPAGRYLLHVRRIGYQAMQGAVVVDAGTVSATIALEVVSRLLAKMVVTETSVDRVKQRLDQNGFLMRSRLGVAATFVERKDILRWQRRTIGELLSMYGIHDGNVMLDRLPFEFEFVRDYPADLVIGMEIYRHSRPTEFNGTRRGPTALSGAAEQPLVVIWTYIP